MPTRLPRSASLPPFALDPEANHRRSCRAFREAMHGRTAEVSRVTGLHQRTLQHCMEPESSQEGPFERGVRIVHALRQVARNAEELDLADEPIREACRQLGGQFVADDAVPSESARRDSVSLCRSIGAYADALHEALEDGVIDSAEDRILSMLESRIRTTLDAIEARRRMRPDGEDRVGPRGVA